MAVQFNEAENPQWRKTFFPIWIGQAISLIGSRLVGFALVWYLTESTGSAIVLTTITLVGMLPEMILAPFAGALADRWNRKKVMIFADGLIAVVTLGLGALFAFSLIEIWHIYVLMFVRSVGGAFHSPAMRASTSLMVPKEKFTKVQGWNQLLQGALSIMAAPMGALALEFMSIGHVLFIDVATAAIAIASLLFVTIPQPAVTTTQEQRNNPLKTMMVDVVEGAKYVVQWKGILYIVLLSAGINAILNPAFSLLPLLVYEGFGLGAPEFAAIQTVMGIGFMAGSLVLSVWGGFKKKLHTSVLGFFGMAVSCAFLSFAPNNAYWMVLVGISIFGLSNVLSNGPIEAIFQEVIEPQMQGRVFSLVSTMCMAAAPLGMIVAGPISEWLGVQTWFFIGMIYLVFMGTVFLTAPAIRHLQEGNPNRVAAEGNETSAANPLTVDSMTAAGD